MRVVETILWCSILFVCSFAQRSERASIQVRSDEEKILNKANLERIKRFIISKGQKCTYSQMFNDNPCFFTGNYEFYLNPDPGGPYSHPQWNANCDPQKGDFNILVIRRNIDKDLSHEAFNDQYRKIYFKEEYKIIIEADDADPEMKVSEIRKFPEQAVKDILGVIEQGKKSVPAGRGKTLLQ